MDLKNIIEDRFTQPTVRVTDDIGRNAVYITRAAALRAYAIYTALFPGQTLDRLSERGGFGTSEMDAFYPEWRNHIVGRDGKKILNADTKTEATVTDVKKDKNVFEQQKRDSNE